MSNRITRAADIPLDKIVRVTGHGPELYTIYLQDGQVVEATRDAYNRARRLAAILKEDEVQAEVIRQSQPAPVVPQSDQLDLDA